MFASMFLFEGYCRFRGVISRGNLKLEEMES